MSTRESSHRPGPSSRPIAVPLVILLGTLCGIAPLATDMYLPAFPAMAEDLQVPASTIQLTLSAFMLGLATGQLVIGAVSDQVGRRRPLVIGSIICAVSAMLCALAPTATVLIGARALMGFSGAAGLVLARSMVADLTEGVQTARYMNVMMMITGVAPVIAPTLGGVVLSIAAWRAIFWLLATVTSAMALGVWLLAPESLPVERRRSGGLREILTGIRDLLGRPRYRGLLLTFVLSFGTLFSYVSGSTFLMQNRLGLSETSYALFFGINAAGMLGSTLISATLVGRFGPQRIAAVGITVSLLAGTGFLIHALTGPRVVPTMILLFTVVSCQGLVFGNVTSMALSVGRDRAGASSALIGALQFGMGALVSPLVGIAGDTAVLPMALCLLLCAAGALTTMLVTTRRIPPARAQSMRR